MHCSTHILVCLSGVVRLEDVPGTMLGILPRWRLFPETIWGPAQLKHTHTHTDGSYSGYCISWNAFDTQWTYEATLSWHPTLLHFISELTDWWGGGERTLHASLDGDPVPYARWRWAGASAGTPQDSNLLLCWSVFCSFGNAPMQQQSYSLYSPKNLSLHVYYASLRKTFETWRRKLIYITRAVL